MIEGAPAIHLKLQGTADALTLVRGMLGGLAELLALDAELLDDLKTAVSEACNNVVMHAYEGPGPLDVALYVAPDAIEAVVRDEGKGIPVLALSEDHVQGVGLPIIQSLAQKAEFRSRPSGGTEVWMRFDSQREGQRLFEPLSAIAPEDGWVSRLSGEAVVSLSPVSLVGAVLGRLARALAAKARFSLDRFSDVYLVTDTIAAHAQGAASGGRIAFGIGTNQGSIELAIGPFRAGSGSALTPPSPSESAGSPLSLLSDEVDVRKDDDGEMLRVVMKDELAASAG